MRAIWVGVGILLTVAVSPAVGQVTPDPRGMAQVLTHTLAEAVGWRFGSSAAASYSGRISWTWTSGDAQEAANVTVTDGEAFCSVTYTDSEGTRSATGPGLLEIMLSIPPDSNTPLAWRNQKHYTFQVACPDPQYTDKVREARWAHSQESYKQPGGEVIWDPKIRNFLIPTALIGSWTIPTADGTETTRLVWDLCLRNFCTSPPKP